MISTAPVHVLPKLVEGTDALDHLANFRYRPMVFVNLCFQGRGILPDTMLWVPDRTQPFFPSDRDAAIHAVARPGGKDADHLRHRLHGGDAYWTMSDEALATMCLDGIARLFPQLDLPGRYEGAGGIARTPVSYPVYLRAYEEARQRFSHSTGVGGLYSIGRNGEFAHILMEDIYWRTLKRMGEVAAYVGQIDPAAFASPVVRVKASRSNEPDWRWRASDPQSSPGRSVCTIARASFRQAASAAATVASRRRPLVASNRWVAPLSMTIDSDRPAGLGAPACVATTKS